MSDSDKKYVVLFTRDELLAVHLIIMNSCGSVHINTAGQALSNAVAELPIRENESD